MSLVYEINNILKNKPEEASLYEDSDLIREYQELLDNGIIKRRGFTLQTIEEKQKDVPDVKIVYNISLERQTSSFAL